jgi:hypothetical protein
VGARLVLSEFYGLTVCALFREEFNCAGSRLMSHLRAAFAISLLPNHCETHYEAEPKHNIPSLFQDDFSPNILQLSDLANLRCWTLQGKCQMPLKISCAVRYVR